MTAEVTWLPHGPQLDVVRVGLDPTATVDDFARLQNAFDYESMDWPLAELLPLFAERFGTDEGRIQGFRRRHFYLNTITFTRINEAVDRLAAAGVASVLGGGLAAMTAYPDSSCRSLPDAELIVAAADFETARTTLLTAGWTVDELDRMCHETGAAVRLTPRLRGTIEGLVHNTDEIASTTTTLTGRPLPITTPELAIVETAIAAVWPAAHPPIRWVVDLELLMAKTRSKAAIDTIVGHARDHNAAHLVRVALRQARRLGARSIPRQLIRRLATTPSTAIERAEVTRRTGVALRRFYLERLWT